MLSRDITALCVLQANVSIEVLSTLKRETGSGRYLTHLQALIRFVPAAQ